MRASSPTGAVAAFYCDAEVPLKKDPRTIFGCLLKQLVLSSLMRNDDALKIILDMYLEHRNDNYRSSPSKSRMRQISKEFASVLEQVSVFLPRLYLIIDGIDECEENKTEVLMTLKSLLDAKTVNVFVASRPEKNIERALYGQPTMKMDKKRVQMDIATHLDWVLEYEEFECDLDERLKEEIKVKLLTKSEGMYESKVKQNLTLLIGFNGYIVNSAISKANYVLKIYVLRSTICLPGFRKLTSAFLIALKTVTLLRVSY